MITQSMTGDSALTEYVHHLLQLHQLIAAGEGDSDAADEIRDAMEPLWHQMSRQQIDFADGLSADLYTIGITRDAHDSPPEEVIESILDAEKNKQWDDVLQLLRQHEKELPAHYVAALRALSLARLELPEAAVAFSREAVRLRHDDPNYLSFQLTLLLETSHRDEAIEQARKIAAVRSSSEMLFIAANAIFQCAELSPDDFTGLSDEAITIAQRALAKSEKSPNDQGLLHRRFITLLYMSLAFDRLGEHEKAMQACSDAIKAEPNNLDAMMMHLMLTSTPTEPRAKDAVRGAIVQRHFDNLQHDAAPAFTNP